jgi:hypothetical protein
VTKYAKCLECNSDAVKTNTGEFYCLDERRACETRPITGGELYFARRMEDREFAKAAANSRHDLKAHLERIAADQLAGDR